MTDPLRSWWVTYERQIQYEVISSDNLFDPANTELLYPDVSGSNRRFVVIDSNVEIHYGDEIRSYFDHHGVDAKYFIYPSGEEFKNIDGYLSIVRELDTFPIHRRDEPIIAIGGGTLTDVVGFVASSYRRSVPHLKVPTTLMGYVDASIGIKTGINFDGHKSRLGSFEPPRKVLLDKTFLQTLPRKYILDGTCEIIKLAVIKDAGLFKLLEEHGVCSIEANYQNEIGGRILDRAIDGMLEELQPNLYEDDLERKVDFGHTFSYGLEVHNESNLLHGEAVLLDIVFSTMIAEGRGLLSNVEVNRIFRLVENLGIPLNTSILSPTNLWDSLEERVCHRNGYQRVPMPDGIGGCVFLNDIELSEIESALEALINRIGLTHYGIQ